MHCLFTLLKLTHPINTIFNFLQRAYATDTRKLKNILPQVTVRDLDLDDEWILNILGLYAPNFQASSLAKELEVIAHQIHVGDKAKKQRGDLATDGKSRTRERLESGIDLQGDDQQGGDSGGVDGVVQRRKRSSETASQRYSNRYTKIIDLMWVNTPPQSMTERSSTWSGIERKSAEFKADDAERLCIASSVPDVKSGLTQGGSIPIDIPNTNSNARTFSNPIMSPVGDSGVCLNLPKDTDSDSDSKTKIGSHDPLGKCCQDNPNIRVFLERFQTAYHCFRVVLQDTVPMAKLQWLYRCIQQINTTAEKQSQLIFCEYCFLIVAIQCFSLCSKQASLKSGSIHLN